MDQCTVIFNELIEEADKLLTDDADNDQIVVLKTAKGTVYHCKNAGIKTGCCDFSGEKTLLKLLREREDTEVQFIIALWNPRLGNVIVTEEVPHSLDLPGFHLRQNLLELDPKNEAALMLLVGEQGYIARTLGSTMPPKQ